MLIIAVAIGIFLYVHKNSTQPLKTTSTGQKVNLNGPTERDKKSGNQVKSDVIRNEAARNAEAQKANSGKKSVTPTITYGDQAGEQVEVGAFVSGIFEDGGTCTLTLEKDGNKQVVSVQAVQGSNSVSCPVMLIPVSSLTPGTWYATVGYSSMTSEGTSTSRAIEVK